MKVKCRNANGYHTLTTGKTYELVRTEPEVYEENCGGFTWPAYAIVIGDTGKEVISHATRFETEDGTSLDVIANSGLQKESH